MTENLPEHLREDIGEPTPEAVSEDQHLQQDVNIPQEQNDGGPEFSNDRYTSGQLNAGQQVPGVSPAGEYHKGRQEELEDGGS
ncbi:hypothetical protein GC088_01970 [Arthrobacter sp. JZ12]|uniref:hypothetical protein n=1 Tax=Arthrobacter sp. JZ12 TaxID=2654190 RepID=UPI002B461073|nr:hypothetical protein [Arthrobacter sp. JZ12]WRH23999.1 hypothetical protein GC088_01970 [Arthrobacter sp. JZ12]